jgi:hypothetical protein
LIYVGLIIWWILFSCKIFKVHRIPGFENIQ